MSDIHYKIALYFRACGRFWFSSVYRPRSVADEKYRRYKNIEKEETW